MGTVASDRPACSLLNASLSTLWEARVVGRSKKWAKGMRVLVCGSRNWADYSVIKRELDKLLASVDKEPFIVIQGKARGADALAEQWCYDNGVPCAGVEAYWQKFGKAAGHYRNEWMLWLEPDRVLAFSEDIDHSKGTRNMVQQATRKGITTVVFSA